MLICICSEKCYDVLKILYFRSKSFIIQRHVDTLASKYVRGCRHKPCKSRRRTLRCPLHVFADHVSLRWDAFAVQVSPMSPSIHCITISYGLLSALGGSFVVCLVDGRWLLHLGVFGTKLIVLGGIFLVMVLVSSNGSHIAVFLSIHLNNAHGSGYCFHKHTVFGCFVLPYRINSHLYQCVISWCHSFPEDRGVRLCRWFVDINNSTCFANADM